MPTEYYVKKTELNERGLRWCLANGYAVLTNQEDNHEEVDEEKGAVTSTAVSNNNDSDLGQIIDDTEESKLSLGETTTTNDDNCNPNLNAATQPKEKEKEATLTPTSSNNNATDKNCQKRDDDNSTTKQHRKATAAASIKNLKRKNHNTVWVRIGKTDHQAYELHNPINDISSKNNNNNDNNDSNEEEEGSTMIWVEWLTTGKKECVHENQINRNGLEGRKRSRPSCFSP